MPTLEKLDKIKIPHTVENILNVVYVVAHGTLDWVQGVSNRVNFTPTVAGIYRFTTASNNNFNIVAGNIIGIPPSGVTVVNTITDRIAANIA